LHERVQRRRRQGIACECLERTHVRTIEPEIAPTAVSGAWFPDDATIDSQRLVAAAMRAAAQRGVKAFFGVAFESLRTTERGIALRGPTLAVEAATVIIAAGAWSAPLLASAGVKLPLRPAHGEMAALKPRGWQVRHAITDGSGYLVPRAGGELLVGSTLQLLGFDQRVTANGLSTLRAHAARLVPRTCAAPLVRAWAGLRPCSTIRRPIIGRLPALPNVILATGHHRNGVVLAPITARVVGDLIAGRPPSVPLAPFKFRRH